MGALAGGLGTTAPVAAQGQVTLSLDVGAATIAYDGFLRSAVASATPSVLLERGRATLLVRGAYARFESGNESIQGTVASSLLSPAVWKLRGELGVTASTTQYRAVTAATDVMAVGRAHLAEPDRGTWIGMGFGGVAQRFLFPDNLLQGELGGWLRVREVMLTAQVTPTRVGEAGFVDGIGAMRWVGPRGEVTGTVGYREGDLGGGVNRWAEGGATLWMTRRLALVFGGGVFPAEILRGLPGGRYASLAMRVASRPPTGSDPALVARLILPYELRGLRRPPGLAHQFAVRSEADGTRTLELKVPGAARVEMMADFTDWTPVPLEQRGSGTWVFNAFLSPGAHRINIRVDGGPWLAPPGLTSIRDDFGGTVGLLIVQ